MIYWFKTGFSAVFLSRWGELGQWQGGDSCHWAANVKQWKQIKTAQSNHQQPTKWPTQKTCCVHVTEKFSRIILHHRNMLNLKISIYAHNISWRILWKLFIALHEYEIKYMIYFRFHFIGIEATFVNFFAFILKWGLIFYLSARLLG